MEMQHICCKVQDIKVKKNLSLCRNKLPWHPISNVSIELYHNFPE